jgi:hypothetical protein
MASWTGADRGRLEAELPSPRALPTAHRAALERAPQSASWVASRATARQFFWLKFNVRRFALIPVGAISSDEGERPGEPRGLIAQDYM